MNKTTRGLHGTGVAAFLLLTQQPRDSNPSLAEIFSLWTVERSNLSSALARDFAKAVCGKVLS